MVTVRVCSKLKQAEKLVVFANKVGKNSRYFVGVFKKTISLLALVGYEMIITYSQLISNVHLWKNVTLGDINVNH